MNKKIIFVGCVETGYELLVYLIENGITVSHILTLNPEQAQKWKVSGYCDFTALAKKHGITYSFPTSYSLKNEADLDFFKRSGFDLLVIGGWQRLIPGEVLKTLSIGALGAHGSAEKLPRGRGRSPINWSLIEGKTRFILHLFLMDEGVDSGPVVDTLEFDINPFDTCDTLYKKLSICFKRLVLKHIPPLLNGTARLATQEGEPTYYPKRTPEDGKIDFHRSTTEIYNLIRAVTRPYPGAFCFNNDQKIMVWEAWPFDTQIDFSGFKPGQVCEVFKDGSFVVRTGSDSLLVVDYEPRDSNIVRNLLLG